MPFQEPTDPSLLVGTAHDVSQGRPRRRDLDLWLIYDFGNHDGWQAVTREKAFLACLAAMKS